MADTQFAEIYIKEIGDTPYIDDVELGIIPLILDSDTPEIKEAKEKYIQKLIDEATSLA